MKFSWMLALALSFGGTALPAQDKQDRTQTERERDCQDDNGVDRCSAEEHRRVLELFGMKPIEEHARAGDQVRRVFYVDGYGRDMVAIAFVRPAGNDAMLSVYWPQEGGKAARAPATALISAETWRNVLRRSVNFARDLQPKPKVPPSDDIVVCLHSWVYTLEATDRPLDVEAMEVTRTVHDACGEGPAGQFAQDAQDIALALVPPCLALDAKQHRNPASQLHACRRLEGDRLAAADAMNRLHPLQFIDSDDLDQVQQVFRSDAVLDWGGQTAGTGAGNAAELWLKQASERENASLFIGRVVGERPDRAAAEGEMVRYVGDGDERKRQVASVSLILEARDGFPLSVSRATVGPWRDVGR